MKRVTKEIKEAMKKLRDEGMTYKRIGENLGLTGSTVQYHLIPKYKKSVIDRAIKNTKVWAGKKEYQKKYMRNRYNTDEEFRERMKKHARNYWRRKRGDKN